jgi:endoglucanase
LPYSSTNAGLAAPAEGHYATSPPSPRPMRTTRRLLCSLFASLLLIVSASHLSAAAPAGARPTIRIKTGITKPLTDETGVVWQADTGFADGETIARPELDIDHTKTPSLYRAERYSMTKFTQELPNGKYTVKLHFAETFEGITKAGERVFSFNVEGKEFKDFDVYEKAGGFAKAFIVTVEVDIKDGKLDITFTPKVENPEINALEILPAA